MRRLAIALSLVSMALLQSAPAACGQSAEWSPAKGPLATRWAAEVRPETVHREYPRPQLVRERWTCLNGLWDYAIRPRGENAPSAWDGRILVPFPIESALSGVMKPVGDQNRLWYRRRFEAPRLADGERLLLHFGAVDWEAAVTVNGKQVGVHRGGYDGFSFDITDALVPGSEQEIVVAAWDPTDKSFQPRGKQVSEPRGIWYTAVTGIWQTVWLEPVPAARIESLRLTPDVDAGAIEVGAIVRGATADVVALHVEVLDDGDVVQEGTLEVRGGSAASLTPRLRLAVPDAKLWSPDEPFLYDLRVRLLAGGKETDAVTSYFGMRKIALGKDTDGFLRLFLNNRPLFQLGPLDQGWWPDGLYTAPSDAALAYDVEVTRQLGFNMARKHVKVEPARWYYHCDRLGLLVWQDMPSGDRYIGPNDPDIIRTPDSVDVFRREWRAIIDGLRNHPSIVVWVPFNEGWGQFDTDAILAWTKELDPTRLVDGPSGWADRGTGDMNDMHRYPGPSMPAPEEKRAVVLGEFGGLGLPLEGHLWWNRRNWGYRTYATFEELRSNYDTLYRKLWPLVGKGLAAAVYTQTTDVEGEVNGLMTYDRAVIKLDAKHVAALHAKFYTTPPRIEERVILPTSEREPRSWRYTTTAPSGEWSAADFDDSAWMTGEGGFGEPSTPGSRVRTQWKTSDIWARQTFELAAAETTGLHLRVHHDEDAEVFINGVRVATLAGHTTSYDDLEIEGAALRKGRNVIAVHCRQTAGGQYIDVGILSVRERPR